MPVDDVLSEPLAEEQLRFAWVEGVLHEANQVEMQLCERASHFVEAVLRLHDDFVEAVGERPDFLFLGERAKVSLTAPVRARPANPMVQNAASVELHHIFERGDEIGELWIALDRAKLVRDFEGHGDDHARVIGQCLPGDSRDYRVRDRRLPTNPQYPREGEVQDASERSEPSHAIGARRRSGARERVSGSPRGEAPRIRLEE